MNQTWQKLLKIHASKQIPQALLLIQEHYLGIASLAEAFAQLLLCQAPLVNGACGVCRTCVLYQRQSHPDFRMIGEPDSACGIDDVREVCHFLEQTSHQQGYKVIILHSADKLLPGAGNALLKTLEEPPGPVVFILLARSKRMLDTLKSRCFMVPVGSVPYVLDPQESSLRMKWCLALGQGTNHEDIQQFSTAKPQEALYLFYDFLTALIRYRLQGCTALFNKPDEAERWHQSTQQISLPTLFHFLDKANEAIKTATMPGSNKQLLFESLYYSWKRIQ